MTFLVATLVWMPLIKKDSILRGGRKPKVFLLGVSHVGLSIYSDFGKVVITRI